MNRNVLVDNNRVCAFPFSAFDREFLLPFALPTIGVKSGNEVNASVVLADKRPARCTSDAIEDSAFPAGTCT